MLKKLLLMLCLMNLVLCMSFLPAFAQSSQQIVLKEGFNFVSLTVNPSVTLAELKAQNTAIDDIYLFNASAGGFLSYGDSSLTSIAAGKGYIFFATAAATINLSGSALSEISNINLKSGFNLVGFSKVPETITFSELMNKYPSILGMYSWSSNAGTFIQVVRNISGAVEKLDGVDPAITVGKSYFMYMDSDMPLNYDGAGIIIGSGPISTVATPVITPAGGSFTSTQEVTIACATEGASIKYTLDGSDPLASGTVYSSSIQIASNLTVKAIATKQGMTNSNIAAASFTVSINPLPAGALTDITISGFNKKALMAINVSGISEGGETESIGVVPASVNGPAKMALNFNYEKLGMRDRNFINRAPMYQASSRKRPVITENDAAYTFVINSEDGSVKNLPTTKVYGNATSKCLIFLDDSVTATYDWAAVGQNFDTNVYSAMGNAYGDPTDIDGNGKVVILYYDMGVKERGTYGYFSSFDLTLGNGGNEMEVFYMNIKFGTPETGSETVNPMDAEMIRTLSHEFQHLINYGQRVMIKKVPGMDSWMDEGLAESAEHLIGKTPGTSRINTIKSDDSNKIRDGAPLCVWMQDGEAYALSYTFMQYCKNNARDKEAMFKLLIGHANGDYRAVESVMKNQNSSYTDFASIAIGYRIANLVNGSGIYGYGAENSTFNFSQAAYAPAQSSIKLAPGGNVYLYPSDADIASFVPGGQGSNIRFIRINK